MDGNSVRAARAYRAFEVFTDEELFVMLHCLLHPETDKLPLGQHADMRRRRLIAEIEDEQERRGIE